MGIDGLKFGGIERVEDGGSVGGERGENVER
jgi:hypothetical protein